MSAHHLPYLCRHMLWCEEVGQLESGHWHLTAVVSSTAVRAHRWLLLNILHMRVFVWTRGRTCSISRDILSQCWDWWCPHGLGTLIYEVTGLTHCFFFIFSFFELGTHFTIPVNGCCVHTVATCELHHKGLTGRGKLELIILLNLTVFVKCVNISNWFVSMSTVREVFPTLEVNGLFWQRQKQSTSLLNTRVVDGDIIILSLTPESTVFVPFSWLTLSHHSILRKMIHRTKSQLKTGDPRTTKSNCNAPRSYK